MNAPLNIVAVAAGTDGDIVHWLMNHTCDERFVDIVEGKAADTLATLPGPFDLVFLDADRPSYLTYLELVVPKLRAGGLLVADNVTSHASELQDYLARVKSHPRLFSVTVPIGNGEEIAVKRADGAQASAR